MQQLPSPAGVHVPNGSSSHRRLGIIPTFALTHAVAMLVGLLALSGAALAATHRTAHARKASCTSASARVKRPAGECPPSKHKGKGKAHHASRGHHARRSGKHTGAATPASPSHVPAVCEDASAPVRGADGSFSCEDGSEPACRDGSDPAPSSKGAAPLCPVPAKVESGCEDPSSSECTFGGGGPEPACEDATAPVPGGDGSVFCEDGSEPVCETGASPTFSADGSTLLCEASASGNDSSD
jgi:hypothetical protein